MGATQLRKLQASTTGLLFGREEAPCGGKTFCSSGRERACLIHDFGENGRKILWAKRVWIRP